jgi:hypothetical protein
VHRFTPFLAAAAFAAAGCSDAEGPAGPQTPAFSTLTVDASAGWAYVDFTGATATPVAIGSAGESAQWDLGFNATSVVANGGVSGPGGMLVHCICQNVNATNEQVMAYSAASQLAAFDAITAANVPASASAWSADVFTTSKWYRYNLTGTDHQVWPTFDVYLVQRGSEVYKIQLTNYYGPGGEPRRITFRYAKLR